VAEHSVEKGLHPWSTVGVSRAWFTKTLYEHRFTLGGCSCGWQPVPDAPALPAHEAHVAGVLALHARVFPPASGAS